jgi:hypothetical protein
LKKYIKRKRKGNKLWIVTMIPFTMYFLRFLFMSFQKVLAFIKNVQRNCWIVLRGGALAQHSNLPLSDFCYWYLTTVDSSVWSYLHFSILEI